MSASESSEFKVPSSRFRNQSAEAEPPPIAHCDWRAEAGRNSWLLSKNAGSSRRPPVAILACADGACLGRSVRYLGSLHGGTGAVEVRGHLEVGGTFLVVSSANQFVAASTRAVSSSVSQ